LALTFTEPPTDPPVAPAPSPPAGTGGEPPGAIPPFEAAPAAAATPAAAPIPRTRVSSLYVALVCSLLVLVLLLVFILENTRRIPITFFGATGKLPVGVALLLSAVAGALVFGVVASVRIVQLRRRVRQASR
jgi:uncharacterized integral membrane protein